MLTTDENGVPVSRDLLRTVRVKFHRACGPKGWQPGDPTFKRGDVVDMPLHMARTYVGLSQAHYVDADERPTMDFAAEMDKAAKARSKKSPTK